MDCREFEAHIPARLDGMADAGIIAAMDRHRSGCGECARLLKIHEYIYSTLEATEPVTAPVGLSGRIMAAAAAEAATVTIAPMHRRLLMAVSTAAFVLLGGAFAVAAGYLLRSLRILNIPADWTYLLEWPLLVKAWFLGLLTQQWMQTLVSPIQISSSGLTIPLFLVAAYCVLLGILGLVTWGYFHTPAGSGLIVTTRNTSSRY